MVSVRSSSWVLSKENITVQVLFLIKSGKEAGTRPIQSSNAYLLVRENFAVYVV